MVIEYYFKRNHGPKVYDHPDEFEYNLKQKSFRRSIIDLKLSPALISPRFTRFELF